MAKSSALLPRFPLPFVEHILAKRGRIACLTQLLQSLLRRVHKINATNRRTSAFARGKFLCKNAPNMPLVLVPIEEGKTAWLKCQRFAIIWWSLDYRCLLVVHEIVHLFEEPSISIEFLLYTQIEMIDEIIYDSSCLGACQVLTTWLTDGRRDVFRRQTMGSCGICRHISVGGGSAAGSMRA